MAPDLITVIIISAQEPVSIPAIFVYHPDHLIYMFLSFSGQLCFAPFQGHFYKIAPVKHEHGCDEYRLGFAPLLVFSCLETFIRVVRKAVEVQAVIPVGTPYQRKPVRPPVIYDMTERSVQMFEEACRIGAVIVEGDNLVKN